MKNVEMGKYMGDGGLGFRSHSPSTFTLTANFPTKLTKIMGMIFSTKALVFVDKIFMTENS